MKLNTNRLIDQIKPYDPEKIILFGSFAKGEENKYSDIDLLVIKKTKKRLSQRLNELLPLVWGNVPHVEPQILTPEEFDKAVKENRFFIIEEVLRHGRVIYEKQ